MGETINAFDSSARCDGVSKCEIHIYTHDFLYVVLKVCAPCRTLQY